MPVHTSTYWLIHLIWKRHMRFFVIRPNIADAQVIIINNENTCNLTHLIIAHLHWIDVDLAAAVMLVVLAYFTWIYSSGRRHIVGTCCDVQWSLFLCSCHPICGGLCVCVCVYFMFTFWFTSTSFAFSLCSVQLHIYNSWNFSVFSFSGFNNLDLHDEWFFALNLLFGSLNCCCAYVGMRALLAIWGDQCGSMIYHRECT